MVVNNEVYADSATYLNMAKASALGEKGPPRLSLLTFTIAKHSKVAMLIGSA